MTTESLSLSVVQPVSITAGMLTASNVPENDYPVWSSGTTYAAGNRVILTSTHKIYESVQGANLNKDPSTEPTWWLEVSPTNRWKAFDLSNGSKTVTSGTTPPSISYTIQPGQAVTALAVIGVENATSLQISLTDPVYGTVYNKTVNFAAVQPASNWWSWFFAQRSAPTQDISLDLPAYPNASISIILSGGSSLAVGAILIGQQMRFGLGISQGARVGIQDYSRKETNEFGDTVLVQRAFAKRASFDMLIEKSEVDSLQNFLTTVRAKPCLWIGSSEYESTVVFGFYKNFDILISYPNHADCELELEGLS